MVNQLDLYLKLKYAIQDWLLGHATGMDIANFCGMSHSEFKEELVMWGVTDVTGALREEITQADVFNVVFMLEIKRLATLIMKRRK